MHSRLLRCTLASLSLVVTTGALGVGCLSRPVVPGEPTTKTNFTTSIQEQAVDKLDILFSIDNSASMGDKQAFLEKAIPDLIARLVTPNCLDNTTQAPTGKLSTDDGMCPTGSTPEFTPVHDMHIGIVSSSLGPRLGNACPTSGTGSTTAIGGVTVQDHNDDSAHLLNRTGTGTSDPTESTIGDTGTNNFLAWLPAISANTGRTPPGGTPAVTDVGTLETDFTDLVAGVHQFGCGIESQLENWYRFLIQPDPYASLTNGAANAQNETPAEWVGVDTTILAQRKAFLRPDSLVAIIVLTDENDSEIDVRSIAGQGYQWMSTNFHPPKSTSACATNPGDKACESCAAAGASSDSACAGNPLPEYTAVNDWGYDLNLRHVHMKEKYGLDPQFPITRYINGLTSTVVPDRNGEYPSGAGSYVGTNDCVNPLFAATLPDPKTLSGTIATAPTAADAKALCKLTPGTRSPSLVFYTIIGGVPYQDLNYDPTTGIANVQAADWVKILGNDPINYDYSGIDPHMIESSQPRNTASNGLAAPTAANNADPINGREWITDLPIGVHVDLAVDREYACIFPISPARDCTNADNSLACDCSTPAGKLTSAQTSPVCDSTVVTNQVAAKAYPTIRELEVARALGKQGIASSICPAHTTDQSTSGNTDPLFGYRPAVASIINRLKDALTNQCLPQKLNPDPATGQVPCLILATLGSAGDETKCTGNGLSVPDPTVLAQFRASQEAAWKANGGGGSNSALPDPATFPVCQVAQIVEPAGASCKGGADQGWCYVTGAAAGTTCSQAILFTSSTPPIGSTISLECIESSAAISDAGAAQQGD